MEEGEREKGKKRKDLRLAMCTDKPKKRIRIFKRKREG